jgi:Phospholipase_D-nuclease N-terminal
MPAAIARSIIGLMARLYLLLFFIEIALAAAALISCLSAEEEDIRGLPRIVWVLIILFFPLVGAIAWFVAGRNSAVARRDTWRQGTGFPESERPRKLAPDDDPEFLRKLRDDHAKSDQDLFSKWEEDLRRREEDLRRRAGEEEREPRGEERREERQDGPDGQPPPKLP